MPTRTVLDPPFRIELDVVVEQTGKVRSRDHITAKPYVDPLVEAIDFRSETISAVAVARELAG